MFSEPGVSGRSKAARGESVETSKDHAEENFSTEPQKARQEPRLPRPHENARRQEGAGASPRHGPQAPHCFRSQEHLTHNQPAAFQEPLWGAVPVTTSPMKDSKSSVKSGESECSPAVSSSGACVDGRFPREAQLRRTADYKRVYEGGVRRQFGWTAAFL